MTPDQIQRLIEQAIDHHNEGRFAEAEALYRQVLDLQPNHFDAIHLMGVMAHQMGRNDVAVQLINHALSLRGDVAPAHNNIGEAFRSLGRIDLAVQAYQNAIKFDPKFYMACNNLGCAFAVMGKLDEAMQSLRGAIEIRPDYAESHNNLGNVLQEMGRPDEAVPYFRKAIELKKDFHVAHSNLLRAISFQPQLDPDANFKEHLEYARRYAEPLYAKNQPHPNDKDALRRLRIGYVSPDFREHAVAMFFEPILRHHDHDNFEVFCYANVATPDAVTERLKSKADHWRMIVGMNNDELAEMIRGDGIDILVDLAGHTADNRMLLFAIKPAPVQAIFLGYPNTTGLRTVDWRITDAFADPPGMTEHWHTERLYRLPRCGWCYSPWPTAPEVATPPCRSAGHITFGSFNNIAKVTPQVIGIWSKVLNAIPTSRMLLKANGLDGASSSKRTRDLFAANGVTADRLDLYARAPRMENHLGMYHRVDIALDSFPYCGTTTTCEALWMGVPLVTLAGKAHISRVGVSLLNNIGLGDLVAESPEHMVEIALKLANDQQRMGELRRTMRERLRKSPLMDGPGFARDFENALREMWKDYCAK